MNSNSIPAPVAIAIAVIVLIIIVGGGFWWMNRPTVTSASSTNYPGGHARNPYPGGYPGTGGGYPGGGYPGGGYPGGKP